MADPQTTLETVFESQPPPAPPSGLKVLEPTDWKEVPLVIDSRGRVDAPRRVFGRITRSGNLEVAIESVAALDRIRAGYVSPTSRPDLPEGLTEQERRRLHRQLAPTIRLPGSETVANMDEEPTTGDEIPEELALNLREQRLRSFARKFPPPPAPTPEAPVANTTSPTRGAYVTVLVPAAALHAVDFYLTQAARTDQQTVRAIAYALFTAKIRTLPLGTYVSIGGDQTSARALYRGGVTQESFVPGTFPPGYEFSPLSVASAVPVTSDTVSAVEYFVRAVFRGGEVRGRGVFRTESPPRQGRIDNYLSESGWRGIGRTRGLRVQLWAPPIGPAPAE